MRRYEHINCTTCSPTVALETECSSAGMFGSSVAPVGPTAKALVRSTRPRRRPSRTFPSRSMSSTVRVKPLATSPRTSSRWPVSRSRTKVLVRRQSASRPLVLGSLTALRVTCSRGRCDVDEPPHLAGVWDPGLGLGCAREFAADTVLANPCE